MALSNGTGGYQVGAGATDEAIMFVQGAPTALTAAATATAAQLQNGLFTFDGTAGNLTLPTVALLEADMSSAQKVNSAFDFFVINTDGADSVTLAVGTGWSIVGAAAVTTATSAHFRARKTGDGTWTAYRIS
jgi:enolase